MLLPFLTPTELLVHSRGWKEGTDGDQRCGKDQDKSNCVHQSCSQSSSWLTSNLDQQFSPMAFVSLHLHCQVSINPWPSTKPEDQLLMAVTHPLPVYHLYQQKQALLFKNKEAGTKAIKARAQKEFSILQLFKIS